MHLLLLPSLALGLAFGGGILHLGIALGALLGGLLFGLLGLELGATLSGGLLLGLTDSITLGLDLLLVALDDRAGDEADVIHLGNVDGLGGVLAFLVEPVLEMMLVWLTMKIIEECWVKTNLGVHELGLQLLLLVLVGELGVHAIDLVTELVDGGLELVLLLVGLGDKLVLHVHGVLALSPGLLGSLVEAAGSGGNGEITLANLLLNLAGLLGLLLLGVGVHVTLLLLLLDGLLDLHILDVVSRLDVEDTVQVETGLEFADHEVVVGIGLDALNREAANPGVDLAGHSLDIGVAGLEIEGLLAVECEDLGGRHNIATAEDSEAGVLIGDLRRLLPGEVDGVVDNVVDGEVTDTENGGESSTAEGTTAGNGLILVQGEGQTLAEELADGLLDSGDTGAATDHLDMVNVSNLKLGLGECLLQRSGQAVKKRLDHELELLTLQHSADISVIHERLHAQRCLGVSGQNLLELLGGNQGAGPGLAVGVDVDLELLLELDGEVLGQSLVEVTATEVTIVGGSLHVEFTLAELDNGGSVVGVTNVDEHHTAGLLLGGGEIQLGDTPAESGSGGVVDETQDVETGNITSVDHSAALHISEPSRNADGDVGDGSAQFLAGDVLDLGKVGSDQLSGCELLLLAEVTDLDTGLAIDVDQVACVIFLLDGDIGVVERTADQALERADGVLQVRDLSTLGGLAEGAAARCESNDGARIIQISTQLSSG